MTGVNNGLSIRVRGTVSLTGLTGIRDLLDVVGHAMPVVQLLRELEGLCRSLMRLMEELENGLDSFRPQNDPGAMGKDEAIPVSGDGQVGPHESANGGLGSHGFGPGGYSCTK